MKAIHYGTPNGPACGASFSHPGISRIGWTQSVTCKRCKRTDEFSLAIGQCPHPRRSRSYINRARGNFRCLRCGFQYHEAEVGRGR